MESPISIRVSDSADARPSLSRLAGLEDRPELTGPGLIALLHLRRLGARFIGALVGG